MRCISHPPGFCIKPFATADQGAGHVSGVIAYRCSAIYLGKTSGEVRVLVEDGSAVPFRQVHAAAIQIEPRGAPWPDFISRDGIRGIYIVGDIKNRADAGSNALQLQHLAVRQLTPDRDARTTGEFLSLFPIDLVTLFEFYGKRFQFRFSGCKRAIALCSRFKTDAQKCKNYHYVKQ